MKKLSIEEVNELDFLKPQIHPVFKELEKMEIGEGLFVAHDEWKMKTGVSGTVTSNWAYKLKMKFITKKVETGTYIIRES